MSAFTDVVRSLGATVSMGFYQSSAENFGRAGINRTGWGDGFRPPAGDPFANKHTQVLTYGLSTKKYATADGNSRTASAAGVADVYAATVGDCITGLWGDVCCGPDGRFPLGKEPLVTVEYDQPRTLNRVLVVGNAAWDQYPVEFDVIVWPIEAGAAARSVLALPAAFSREARLAATAAADGSVVYTVANGAAVEQEVVFEGEDGPVDWVFSRMQVRVRKWSAANAVAKFMYFSRDRVIFSDSSDVKSIEVLEERSAGETGLTYAISSNCCTVSVRDKGKALSGNRALLRKDKTVLPSLYCRGGEAVGLGKFYSQEWDMESRSSFVRCKAYDGLYRLQEIPLEFPIEPDENGVYAVPTGFTVKTLIELVAKKINRAMNDAGEYGREVTFDIDPCLDSLAVPYLTLPSATAWETLQSIADFALCRFYAARDGRIRAEYDMCTCPKTPLPNVAITPDNTFSHRLPLQPKLIVNRVVVPYTELVELSGAATDFQIELKETDGQRVNDRIEYKVAFKNFYPRITAVDIFDGNNPLNVDLQVKKLFYDSCIISTLPISFERKIYVEITGEMALTFNQEKLIDEEKLSNLKANGVNEYTHVLSPLMLCKSIAESRKQGILNKYGEGLDYAEVEWKGSPELKIGDKVMYQYPGGESESYTCVSNELVFTGGLRCKTILRKE